jgi:hypothetical protein
MILALTYEEREFLVQTMRNYLSDLRFEIARTDSRQFKSLLKQRWEIAQAVIEKLESPEQRG